MTTLFETTPATAPVDLARIEADAHRLRAEALRDGLRSLRAGLARLWGAAAAKGLRAA